MQTYKTASVISYTLALCYIIGFIFLFTSFRPLVENEFAKQELLAFYRENKMGLQIWYLIIYIVFGVLLVPLVLLIKKLFKRSPLNSFSSIIGYIWAAFVIASGFIFSLGLEKIYHLQLESNSLYLLLINMLMVQDALGGGVELLGGIWVVCIGLLAMYNKTLNRIVSGFSIIVGGIGILTVFPFFYGLNGVFGVLQIAWFIWLGTILFTYKKDNNCI